MSVLFCIGVSRYARRRSREESVGGGIISFASTPTRTDTNTDSGTDTATDTNTNAMRRDVALMPPYLGAVLASHESCQCLFGRFRSSLSTRPLQRHSSLWKSTLLVDSDELSPLFSYVHIYPAKQQPHPMKFIQRCRYLPLGQAVRLVAYTVAYTRSGLHSKLPFARAKGMRFARLRPSPRALSA